MQTVILVIHLLIALALIGVVLLQRSEGGALGIGGGGGGGAGNLFSARGVGNALTRTTACLAVAFFCHLHCADGASPHAVVVDRPFRYVHAAAGVRGTAGTGEGSCRARPEALAAQCCRHCPGAGHTVTANAHLSTEPGNTVSGLRIMN